MVHSSDAESHDGKRIPIDLTRPLVLKVHSLSGDVSIQGVDRTDVLVGVGSPDHWDEPGDDIAALTIEARDNQIEVRPRQPFGVGWTGNQVDFDLDSLFGQISRALRFGGPTPATKTRNGAGRHDDVDIVIELPRMMTGRIEVHSASGDVRIEGCSGEIGLTTMSGDIKAARMSGELKVQTASGDLIVEDANGRLLARTASGDVHVNAAQLAGFEMQTANGDIFVDAVLVDSGACRAHTASGDVHLSLRRPAAAGEEPAATLAFHTVAGDAHVEPPFRQTERRRWQSGGEAPGPQIDVTTVNGDLHASLAATESVFGATPDAAHREDAAPAAWASPVVPSDWPHDARESDGGDAVPDAETPTMPGNADRLAVLEAVERGEIDVEEALRRLDAEDATVNF